MAPAKPSRLQLFTGRETPNRLAAHNRGCSDLGLELKLRSSDTAATAQAGIDRTWSAASGWFKRAPSRLQRMGRPNYPIAGPRLGIGCFVAIPNSEGLPRGKLAAGDAAMTARQLVWRTGHSRAWR
jgi:hypothetical protein